MGLGEDTMVSSAKNAAHNDLKALAPPSGLTQELFEAFITGILKQMPLITEIDDAASRGLTDSQANEFLLEKLGTDSSNAVAPIWRVLKAWLLYFFPETYRTEMGEEVLVKGQELSN